MKETVLIPRVPQPTAGNSDLIRDLASRYDLHDIRLQPLHTLVNDVLAVTAAEGTFACKFYHRNRSAAAVKWEIDLLLHLRQGRAPVVPPVRGRDGYLERLSVDGQPRLAVLFGWAAGVKPQPGEETYRLLGAAAARIHQAADGFAPSPARESYDATALIDDQLGRMRHLLAQTDRWTPAVALGERMKERLADPGLDRGICHMDLTLDNVHRADELTVFDFDSAGLCWRAVEPWGVLRFSAAYFQAWLAGYRTVRPFSAADQDAVAAFGIIGDLRVVAWQLGVAESSRGVPLLNAVDLPAVVDGWLEWEATHLVG